jgi:hypothetical protein
MNRTKRTLLNTVCSLAMALTVTASAHAQSSPLSANIPFNFKLGDATFRSGKYTIQTMLNSTALLIRSVDDPKASAISLANQAPSPAKPRSSRLVFKTYGDQYFLSTVEWSGGPYREVPRSKVEIELAKRTREPKRLEVAIK